MTFSTGSDGLSVSYLSVRCFCLQPLNSSLLVISYFVIYPPSLFSFSLLSLFPVLFFFLFSASLSPRSPSLHPSLSPCLPLCLPPLFAPLPPSFLLSHVLFDHQVNFFHTCYELSRQEYLLVLSRSSLIHDIVYCLESGECETSQHLHKHRACFRYTSEERIVEQNVSVTFTMMMIFIHHEKRLLSFYCIR